ncbi:spheroidene monooxygenase [Nonomuraea sp. MCN248]|uniref:Spheroidene monooxygenase n=1 Tax=Nonomuraea corallina TaxID=2989783 RepID=A0ABT4S4Y6_9ACTN|nr:spheroidene monooxygenase [Nonomuraea corallina]MDA0632118.1 spheroidene monooxygenase [Nonomuraea corallina]
MTDTSTSTIASFHLIRYDSARAMRHMAFDRPLLRRAGGLLFWRLLGTGQGRAMSLGADLRRWALFAVWRGEDDLDAFLRASPIAARWRSEASEFWQVRLAPTASRGAWSGRDPFALPPPSGDTPAEPQRVERAFGSGGEGTSAGRGGPVAVLTRASIRPRRLVAFYRSVPPVDELLRRQDGCLASIGVGEWPLARQATFSLWRDREAVRAFAYRGEAHRQVIERVRADDWYAEELFARFTPYAAEGTWDGIDPLR